MDAKNGEFLKRLKAIFQTEAAEHIQAMSAGLIELEKSLTPERSAEVIEVVFREAHSLKGAARSVNLSDIESICHALETVFSVLKRQTIVLSPSLFDLLHQAVDTVGSLVSCADGEGTPTIRGTVRELTQQLIQVATDGTLPERPDKAEPPPETPSAEVASRLTASEEKTITSRPLTEETPVLAGTVRIPTARLDSLFLQAEEMVQVKMAVSQRSAELEEIKHALVSWKTESAKWKDRMPTAGISQWREWQGRNDEQLGAFENRVAVLTQAMELDLRTLKRMVDEHLETTKRALMLPVASLVDVFPKVVRDLARDQGKEVKCVIFGADIEIDKRILEGLKDPLIHLIRNCVDHGIEKPNERIALDKPSIGTITISFNTIDSRQVEILVSDDGAGIDVAQIRKAAINERRLSPEAIEKLDVQETLTLAFQSGVSTSRIITDVSGRGLGLAIVREKVESLGGVVSVDTQTNVGTTFRLFLPLTLSTFRGVLLRVDDQVFIVPTLNVERALRVKRDAIKTVKNRETIQVNGQILSLVGLGDVLELPLRKKRVSQTNGEPASDADYLAIVVLKSNDQRIAFQVDEVLNEQQVMVKGLGSQLQRVRNVAGAAVLSSGKVVPVLNVSDLMNSAVRSDAKIRSAARAEETPLRKERILLAEDSITARTLLKSILETAGYQVTTAVDGADAFAQARSAEFDLVLSDVDMPRMSGFELTAKIRGDKKLGELPVVLVTALDSREDRERGIDAGASAYIVKSSFDQSNLLDVIGRLL